MGEKFEYCFMQGRLRLCFVTWAMVDVDLYCAFERAVSTQGYRFGAAFFTELQFPNL